MSSEEILKFYKEKKVIAKKFLKGLENGKRLNKILNKRMEQLRGKLKTALIEKSTRSSKMIQMLCKIAIKSL